MADQMSTALLAFARHGDPNHRSLPRWKQYSLERRETLLFDVPSQLANDRAAASGSCINKPLHSTRHVLTALLYGDPCVCFLSRR